MVSNRSTIKLLIGGCLIALLTGLTVSYWYQKNPCERFVENPASVYSAVYCSKDIPANSVITEDQLEVKNMPLSRLPANACDCIYVPVGRRLPYPKKKGEYISLREFGIARILDGVESIPMASPPIVDRDRQTIPPH